MEEIFNVLLIIGFLIVIYYCIQKYKDIKNIKINKPNEEILKVEHTNELSNFTQQDPYVIEKFNMDKIKNDKPIKTQNIKFNYNTQDIEHQFMNEQINGVHFTSLCPNRWIESFDSNGNPIYNSRENVTGVLETFIEPKARFSYEFNKENTLAMGGIIDPDNFIDGSGKPLKEIYDNSFIDFKKLIPKKTIIDNESKDKTNTIQAASELYYLTPDTWVYENEKQENGGKSIEGIYASDPAVFGLEAVF